MYTCDALETIQSKTLLHTFAPNYTVLWRLKRNFLFPHTPLVISSFNRYHWPKIIISMPFDSSNQLYFVVLVFLWAYMRHVELSYILEVTRMHGDPQLSASLAPKTPISPKGPSFRGCFFCGEITQRPLHFGEIENISHSLKLKTPMLPPIGLFGQICMLTPKYPYFCPFPLSEYLAFVSASHTL